MTIIELAKDLFCSPIGIFVIVITIIAMIGIIGICNNDKYNI